jgi:hypothetical protein
MRKTRAATRLVFALFRLLSAARFGCSRNTMDYGPMLASAETRGELVYERNCSPCHEAQNLQPIQPDSMDCCRKASPLRDSVASPLHRPRLKALENKIFSTKSFWSRNCVQMQSAEALGELPF